MTYKIILQPGAVSDVEQIIGYLADRSLQRAASWRNAWNDLLNELRNRPERFGIAPESSRYEDDVRHALFKTRRGRTYRALFVIVDDTVNIIHVRGPGQDLLSPDDLQLP
jgi:plasmid stabilization system protein ParE